MSHLDSTDEHVSHRSGISRHRGFTLAEMLIVLVIMAIMTTVAAQSLLPVVGQSRYDATVKTLTEIQAAIEGPASTSAAAGQGSLACFVADAGRMPFNLEELNSYNSSQASVFDFVIPPNPYNASKVLDVKIPCGWHGPYMRVPAGNSTIVDGWGRGWGVGLMPITDSSSNWVGVKSLGADGLDDASGGSSEGFNADVPVYFHDAYQSVTLRGTVYQIDASMSPATRVRPTKRDSDGKAIAVASNPDENTPIVATSITFSIHVFRPLLAVDPGSAATVLDTRSEITTITVDAPVTTPVSFPLAPVNYTLALPTPAIGPRAIQVFMDEMPVGSPVYLNVRPGQTYTMDLGVPAPIAVAVVP